MKYNEGDKYIILEGDNENLAVELSKVAIVSPEVDTYSSINNMLEPVGPIEVPLNESDTDIINSIRQYAHNVGLIGLSSIRILHISPDKIIVGNKYSELANRQFGLDTFSKNSELFFNKEKDSINTEKGSIYLLEKLKSGIYIDYLPSFHRLIGKTTVLLEKANQLANEGKKVLYLTKLDKYMENRYIKSFGNSNVLFRNVTGGINENEFSYIIFDEVSTEEFSHFRDINHIVKPISEKYGYMIG